jgi:SAM-dependent methyltransferase
VGTPVPAPTDWWEDLYRSSEVTELPWYTPLLDSDFELALKTHLPDGGKVLDLGTGPATQAIALAKRGYEVVASDVAPSAIEKAKHAASREHVLIDFRVDNILDSKLEDGLVDAIVDRGVFHVLPPESRPRYVAAVRRILRPRGYLLLKAFSDQEPRRQGPYHIAPAELRARFEKDFEVLSIEDAAFHGTLPHPPKALLAVLRRR